MRYDITYYWSLSSLFYLSLTSKSVLGFFVAPVISKAYAATRLRIRVYKRSKIVEPTLFLCVDRKRFLFIMQGDQCKRSSGCDVDRVHPREGQWHRGQVQGGDLRDKPIKHNYFTLCRLLITLRVTNLCDSEY